MFAMFKKSAGTLFIMYPTPGAEPCTICPKPPTKSPRNASNPLGGGGGGGFGGAGTGAGATAAAESTINAANTMIITL